MHRCIDWRRIAQHLLRTRTTKQLAHEVGLSQPTVSRLSTGRTATLGADAAIRLIELAGGQVVVPELTNEHVEGAGRVTA